MGKKLREEDLILNIIVNGDRGKKEIGELERAIKDTNKELRALEKQQKDLIATGQKETEQYRAVTAAIKSKNEAIVLAESRLKQLKSTVDLNTMSLSDLRREMNQIRRLRDLATPLSDQWKAHEQRLQQVTARYNQLNGTAQTTGLSLQNMASRFNHYIGVITAGFATMYAAVSGVKKAINDFAEFDDKVADVMKTTGLYRSEVIELNEEFKKIDTRTAQNDLLGLARVAGKLGIEGQEDILGFVRATDQIGVALAEDLGGNVEEAINQVGKLVEIFKIDQNLPLEEALLKVGSTINELGAASTANEGYIVEFTRRMAGVGPLAKMTITDLMGMAATLDSLGQTSEVSTTALSQLFLAMAKNSDVFAKYANMDVDSFRQLLDTDANEAFLRVLEGVKGSSDGLTNLATSLGDLGQDGGRVIGVIGSLANNIGTLREQQLLANTAFEEGTSLTEEFNVKNQTQQAQLEKARKGLQNMVVELGEKLVPVMEKSISGFGLFVRILSVLVDFFFRNIKVITVLTAAVVAYNAALWISNINLKENIVLSKAKLIWDNAQLAATQLLAAAQMLLAGNIKGAAQAMRVFNSVAKLNPWVLLASVIIAAGTALYMYTRRLSEAETAQKTLNEIQGEAQRATIKERLEMEKLLRIARDKKRSDQERLEAVQALNKLSPKYLGNLTLEKINTEEATKATDNYIKSLVKRAAVQAAEERLVELQKKKLDLAKDATDLSFFEEVQGVLIGRGNVIGKKLTDNAKDLLAQERSLLKFIEESGEKVKPTLDQSSDFSGSVVDGTSTETKSTSSSNSTSEANREAQRLQDQRDRELEAQAAYRQKVLEGQLSLIEQERLAHQRRLEEAGIAGKQRQDLNEEEYRVLLALEKEHYSNLDKLDAEAIAKDIDRRQSSFDDQLEELRIHHNEEFKQIKTIEQARAALQGELSNEALNGIKNMRQAQRELDKKYRREEEAFVRKHLENLQAELQAALQSGSVNGVDLADEILSDEEKALLISRLNEVRKILSELGLGSGTEIAEDAGRRGGNVDVLGFSPDDWTTFFDNLENGRVGVDEILMGVQALQTMWNQYNAFVAAGEARQLQQFEADAKAKEDRLKRQLDAGVINQETYGQAVDKINADLDRKKAVYERNQAKRERNVALMSAIVNTASAVSAALPNLLLAAIVGTMGGLQIGAILKTPLPDIPGAENGGRLMDVTRSQDRKMFRAQVDFPRRGYVDRPTIIAGESGREFVANDRAVRNPTIRPVIDAIDTAQRNGTIDSLNLNRIMEQNQMLRTVLPGRQRGGRMTASTVTAPAVQPFSSAPLDELKSLFSQNLKIMGRLSAQLEMPIQAEVVLTGRKGLNERQKELSDIEKSANL